MEGEKGKYKKMKNKDHMLLEQLYSKVKPVNLYKEEYTDKVDENTFIAEVENVSVYNVDQDSYSLGVESNKLTLVYKIEIDFRKWGIKDFLIIPVKLMPFTVMIEDDYNEEDFTEAKPLVEFSKGIDASDFRVDGVSLTTASSLFPTMIDLYIKKVGDKWEVVPEQSEISF
jgi:hypothetical protein